MQFNACRTSRVWGVRREPENRATDRKGTPAAGKRGSVSWDWSAVRWEALHAPTILRLHTCARTTPSVLPAFTYSFSLPASTSRQVANWSGRLLSCDAPDRLCWLTEKWAYFTFRPLPNFRPHNPRLVPAVAGSPATSPISFLCHVPTPFKLRPPCRASCSYES